MNSWGKLKVIIVSGVLMLLAHTVMFGIDIPISMITVYNKTEVPVWISFKSDNKDINDLAPIVLDKDSGPKTMGVDSRKHYAKQGTKFTFGITGKDIKGDYTVEYGRVSLLSGDFNIIPLRERILVADFYYDPEIDEVTVIIRDISEAWYKKIHNHDI